MDQRPQGKAQRPLKLVKKKKERESMEYIARHPYSQGPSK